MPRLSEVLQHDENLTKITKYTLVVPFAARFLLLYIMIGSFPGKSSSNVGGVATFQFVPFYFLVPPFPPVNGKQITTAFNFLTGNFLQGYATLETMKFTETPKLDDNGAIYQWDIEGFTPGDSAGLVSLMEHMELVQHVVITKDMNGLNRLVGYNAPLDFQAVFSPGNDVSSARGYNWTFTGAGPKRAPVYAVT